MSTPTQAFELREKVAALSAVILSKHPTMPTLLQQIHKTIKAYPEQITILTEEEIRVIVSGLEVQTQTFIVQQTVGSKGKSSKSIAAKLATLGDDAL